MQDDFVATAKAQLDNWNAEIKKMQASMQKMQEDGADQMKSHLAAMEEQRAAAQAKLEKLGRSNVSAMQDMQSAFQDAWKSIEKGMEDARKKMMD